MKQAELAKVSAEARRLSKSMAAVDARLATYMRKYDPDQPRDANGRFASTGAAGAVSGGGRILTPGNSPSWWPTASRDLLIIGALGTAAGFAPIVRIAGKRMHRAMLRGMGPVASRMAQRFGGHISGHFQTLARSLGFKVPKGSMRGVPSRYMQRAWDKLPKDVQSKIDRHVNTVAAATRRAKKPGAKPIVKPSGKPKPPKK
jgi:hypothetical protein